MTIISFSPEFPFKLFAGPIPCPSQETYDFITRSNIKTIVCLLEDEMFEAAELKEFYEACEAKVIRFPIPDFGVPNSIKEVHQLASRVFNDLKANNALIHCMGGKGRTGMMVGCLIAERNHLKGDDAIAFVREQIPGAIETEEQEQFVRDYAKKYS